MSTMNAAQVADSAPGGRSYLRALEAAVAAIYFADSADYLRALWSVVRHLSPITAIELEKNELKAFHDVKEVVDQIDESGGLPALYLSAGQVAAITARKQTWSKEYLPYRHEAEGNFTLPVYLNPAAGTAHQQQDDEVTRGAGGDGASAPASVPNRAAG